MTQFNSLTQEQVIQTALLQQIVEQLQNINIKMDGLINITHNQHQEKSEVQLAFEEECENNYDLLAYCQDDAYKWAEQFCKRWPSALCEIEGKEGVMSNSDWFSTVHGWFANAIEHSYSIRTNKEDVPAPTSSVRPGNASQHGTLPTDCTLPICNYPLCNCAALGLVTTGHVADAKTETSADLNVAKDPEYDARDPLAHKRKSIHEAFAAEDRAQERDNRPDVPIQKHRDFNTGAVEDNQVTWGDIANKKNYTGHKFMGMNIVYHDQVDPYQILIVDPDGTVITTIHLPQEIDASSTRVVVSSNRAPAQKQKS